MRRVEDIAIGFSLPNDDCALSAHGLDVSTVLGGNIHRDLSDVSSRKCGVTGCSKLSRGNKRLCISHGGGRRCSLANCSKSARSNSTLCIAHGGGKRCAQLGCTKSAIGRSDCCAMHGGGKRCIYAGCLKVAQGNKGLCIAHGGGKRCCWEGCRLPIKRANIMFCRFHSDWQESRGTGAQHSPPEDCSKSRLLMEQLDMEGSRRSSCQSNSDFLDMATEIPVDVTISKEERSSFKKLPDFNEVSDGESTSENAWMGLHCEDMSNGMFSNFCSGVSRQRIKISHNDTDIDLLPHYYPKSMQLSMQLIAPDSGPSQLAETLVTRLEQGCRRKFIESDGSIHNEATTSYVQKQLCWSDANSHGGWSFLELSNEVL